MSVFQLLMDIQPSLSHKKLILPAMDKHTLLLLKLFQTEPLKPSHHLVQLTHQELLILMKLLQPKMDQQKISLIQQLLHHLEAQLPTFLELLQVEEHSQ
jgi:hypothetical protein